MRATAAGDAGPSGNNSFYTDLAFDPLTGDLIGTGTDSQGRFIPYRLPGSTVLTGNGHTYTYVDAFTSWNANFYDGLAYNRLTGGVAQLNRNTGAFLTFVGATGGTGIGTDLAVQADTIPGRLPEPATIALLGLGLAGFGFSRRRELN